MKYFYLIIVAKGNVHVDDSIDCLIINSDCTLIDDKHLICNNKTYEFEYLIYSNELTITNSLVMLENNIPITNYYYQTSLEHIYYITEDNLQEKIDDIINNE